MGACRGAPLNTMTLGAARRAGRPASGCVAATVASVAKTIKAHLYAIPRLSRDV
jgi:hypothetical protein